MPISKDGNGVIQYTPPVKEREFEQTGVVRDEDFALADSNDVLKQVKFSLNPSNNSAGTLTIQLDVGADSTVNLSTAIADAGTATSANTASTIVKRDSSGNFSAGTISAALSGNATTATTATNFSGSLVGDVTGTQGATVVSTVGTSSAANVHAAELLANAATSANTVSTIVKRDGSGNFSAGTITATLSGSSTNFSGSLVGDVTGTQGATVVSTVGTSSAANVHAAELLANAATNSNTNSTIVKRDSSGNFSAGTITATLTGNATNVSGTVAIANGGTGQTSKAAGFDALSPMTTSGDIIYGGASGTGTRLATGTAGYLLKTGTPPVWTHPVAASIVAPNAVSSTDIDWSLGNLHTKTLSANTTFTFSNRTSGQTIIVRLTNTASNYTVTWPTVKWVAASAPTMTTGAKSDVYTFVYDGTDVFGSAVQNLS